MSAKFPGGGGVRGSSVILADSLYAAAGINIW